MRPIRTKFHRLWQLILAGEVYLTAERGGLSQPLSDHDHQGKALSKLFDLIHVFSNLPKFVFDPDLAYSMHTEAANESLFDMKEAGLLRLPFPSIIVEVPIRSGDRRDEYGNPASLKQSIVVLQEAPGEGYDFVGYDMSVNADADGEYAVVAPSPIAFVTDKPSKKLGIFGIDAFGIESLGELAKKTSLKDAGSLWRAVFCATLLLSTRGMTREVIECQKLNKHRVASGKLVIPHHTYISLGRVYKSKTGDASTEYIPGKSPMPHWRRGHISRWRTGSFKTPLEERGWGEKWIDGRFVALAADAVVGPTPAPEYHVGR
jgi:hypothetical protein